MTPDNTVWKPTVPWDTGAPTPWMAPPAAYDEVDLRPGVDVFHAAPSATALRVLAGHRQPDLLEGGTYGIGTVVVHADEPIPDRAAAQRPARHHQPAG